MIYYRLLAIAPLLTLLLAANTSAQPASFQEAFAAPENWSVSAALLAVDGGAVDASIKGGTPDNIFVQRATSDRLGWRLGAAWEWLPSWSMETAYVALGDADVRLGGSASNDRIFAVAQDLHPQSAFGLAAGLRHHWQLDRGLRLSLGAGIWQWRAEWSVHADRSRHYHETGTDLFVNAAMEFQALGPFRPRLRWDRYKLDAGEVDAFAMELRYRFD